MPKNLGEKGFAGIALVAVAVMAVGVAAYFLGVYLKTPQTVQTKLAEVIKSPTPVPTPSDKVYQDTTLGFSFTYPAGYEVISDNEADFDKRAGGNMRKNFKDTWWYDPPTLIVGVMVKPINKDVTSEFDPVPMTLWVFDNPNDLDAQVWYKKYWYYPFVWGEYEPWKEKDNPNLESTVSGQLTEEKLISQQPGTPRMVYINYNHKMYLFRIVNPSGSQNLGDDILKSFKLPLPSS